MIGLFFCVYVKSDFCKFAAVYMLVKKKVSLIGNVILMWFELKFNWKNVKKYAKWAWQDMKLVYIKRRVTETGHGWLKLKIMRFKKNRKKFKTWFDKS